MKHNFTVQRYYCKYCGKFRIKNYFYNKNKMFLKDKNNNVICIDCWNLNLHNQDIWFIKKKI